MGKPATIVGAGGRAGTARAQMQLLEHGCTRRDFGDVPIPFVWMPAGSEPPNV